MKAFEVPHVEIVRFTEKDVVLTSCIKDCTCVDCSVCPPGSNDCGNYDFGKASITGFEF